MTQDRPSRTGADTAAARHDDGEERSERHPGGPGPRRSRRHRVVAGVCGGLGRHYDLDPVIFRVVLGVTAVVGGLGLIAYGCAWLLLPAAGEEENELRRLLSGRVTGFSLTALLCALVGCGLVTASLSERHGALVFSLLLMTALVGAVHWARHREGGTSPGVGAPPEAQAPPVPAAPTWWRATGRATDTGYLWGPDETALPPVPGPTPGGPPAPRPRERAPRDPRLGRLVVLGAFLALAAGVAITAPSRPLGDSLVVGGACALGVLGLGLVVSAFTGRLGAGTVVTVVVMAALVTGGAVLPDHVTASWGDARWRPTSTAQLRDGYALGNGHAVLDLTHLTVGDDTRPRSRVELGLGLLEVRLPDDVQARLHLTVGLGNYRLPGGGTVSGERLGGGAALDRRVTVRPASGQRPRVTLELRLALTTGEMTVVQRPAAARPEDDTGRPDDTPDDTGREGPQDARRDDPARRDVVPVTHGSRGAWGRRARPSVRHHRPRGRAVRGRVAR